MPTTTETLAMAGAHHRAGRLKEAEEIYREILSGDPDNAQAWQLLGVIAHQRDNDAEAIDHIRRALALNPRLASAYNNLGLIYQRAGNETEAIVCYQRALEINPQYAEATFNLGRTHDDLGRYDQASALYDRAVELQPDLGDARLCRATLNLLRGDFEAGWREFEWRWTVEPHQPREIDRPKWDGKPLFGKTILLHGEQGLGDNIQFIRYAPLVKERRANIVFVCQTLLVPLMESCPGIDRVIATGEKVPRFDVHAPLLSLPGIFNTTLESVPANVPYLFAYPALVEKWRERLAELHGLKIGINWQGRVGKGEFRKRDIPLDCCAKLGQIPGVRLVSLQKGVERGEVKNAGIWDPGDDWDKTAGAFMDTAAIIKNLDLVITSDTSIAHLAGALGVQVWVALPFVPDWRWMLDRSDSPWYPTMRLFRQKQPGDWEAVFQEIRKALAQWPGMEG